MAFNKIDFAGLRLAKVNRFGVSEAEPDCFVAASDRTQRNQRRLDIYLDRAAGKTAVDVVGPRCVVLFDRSDGKIYLRSPEPGEEGDARTICSNDTGLFGSRSRISICTAFEEYTRAVGPFSRMYLEPRFYSNAVVLVPTGRRDAA